MTDCNCELCQISAVLQAIKPRCTPEENRILEVLWDRLEYAELERWSRDVSAEKRGAG